MTYTPQYFDSKDPFRNPSSTSWIAGYYLPSRPSPAAVASSSPRLSREEAYTNPSHEDVPSHVLSPDLRYLPITASTASSSRVFPGTGDHRMSRQATSMRGTDLEGGVLGKEQRHSTSRRSSRDTGKSASCHALHLQSHRSSASVQEADRVNLTYEPDVEDDGEQLEDKTLKILLYLSGPCSVLSLATLFWFVLVLILLFLSQPLRLCSTRTSFRAQCIAWLAPSLNLQLSLIYSTAASSTDSYGVAMLLVIYLLSPIVSLGVAIAAWVAAVFWIFSAIVGDPSGPSSHNDGKETVLGVRAWWERWLTRALR
ncbi:hypothetical protein LTR04_000535 [Oleoguttula sp. CCFEE 6159]|nr:hypothetical protein LTR04_000535 [Oleoguttula sp. CCFEE 6159]